MPLQQQAALDHTFLTHTWKMDELTSSSPSWPPTPPPPLLIQLKMENTTSSSPLSERNVVKRPHPQEPSSPSPTPQQGQGVGEGKLCGVCGDKALGNNFNAITCESCKAFFRRNALRKKDFLCPFQDNCKVDPVTRRFCQKCRLKKCFDIGMKKEWIMTDEEKKIKKAKIEQNRLKRGAPDVTPPSSHPPPPDPSSPFPSPSSSSSSSSNSNSSFPEHQQHPPPPPQDQQQNPILSSLVRPPGSSSSDDQQPNHNLPPLVEPCPSHPLQPCPCPPYPSKKAHLMAAYNPSPPPPPLPLNTLHSILQVAISAEFSSLPIHQAAPPPPPPDLNPLPPPLSPTGSPALNAAEKGRLSELFFASEALDAPVDAEEGAPLPLSDTDPSLITVINLTDIAIRRLIKMAKKITAFKTLCQEDQIALLKGGATEMMILRSVVSYDPERDSWNIPHSNGFNLKLGVLKEAGGSLYEEHQRFVKSFRPEWRSDYNVMIILCAITLFTPERANVIHGDVVRLEQESYYYLLKRYLESTRNGCEARSTYLQLIQRIAELHVLNENHIRVFLEVNPKDVEPLLIEIFDLKQ